MTSACTASGAAAVLRKQFFNTRTAEAHDLVRDSKAKQVAIRLTVSELARG
jgi:hypothetical protein